MKFTARAKDVNGQDVWEGFYAELKEGNEKTPVIIDVKEGIPRNIIPSTLQWCTGIQTEKAQTIYEGDKVVVWSDTDRAEGIVEWSIWDAGWVVRDAFGELHDLVGDTRCFV